MKKYLFIALSLFLLASCGKDVETFRFEGAVIDYVNCSLMSASISDIDYGYVIALTSPDTIGKDYYDVLGKKFTNCVILYRTKSRFEEGEVISGEMYLDDRYSRAYCTYHTRLDLPEGVCYRLD